MTPKTDAMAVVWELDKAMKATITYGTAADDQKTVDVPVEEGRKVSGRADAYVSRTADPA